MEPDRLPFPLSDPKTWRLGPLFVSELSSGTLLATVAATALLYLLAQRTPAERDGRATLPATPRPR